MSALRLVLTAALASAPLTAAWAQDVRDGDTLPARAGGLIISPAFSGGTERFGPQWRFFGRESILADFANIDLKRTIAGDNTDALDFVLDPNGTGRNSLGYTQFDATQTSIGVNFTLAYGITDRLTVALALPFSAATYELDAHLREYRVDSEGNDIPSSRALLTNRRIKDVSALRCDNGELDISAENFGDLLEEGPESYRFNVDDLRRALTSYCLGYQDPFTETYDGADGYRHARASRNFSGFRDLILGAKYQWFHGRNFNLSSLMYVVLPTGTPDDPDDLFDPAFGDGQTDVALLLGATVPLGDFRIGVSAGYEIQFADHIVRRLSGLTFNDELETKLAKNEISEQDLYDEHLDDGTSVPLVTSYDVADVARKLGDNIYVYSSFSYQILEWLGVGMTLDYLHHFRDEITDTGSRVARKFIVDPADPNKRIYERDDDGRFVYESRNERFPTSAELRAEAPAIATQRILDGRAANDPARMTSPNELTADERANQLPDATLQVLKETLPSSAERKAAGYAWHTVRSSVVAGFSININTLGPFLRDEFPVPLLLGLSATVPVGGKNLDAIDSFGLSLTIPFITGEVKDPAEYGYDDDDDPAKSGLPWP